MYGKKKNIDFYQSLDIEDIDIKNLIYSCTSSIYAQNSKSLTLKVYQIWKDR